MENHYERKFEEIIVKEELIITEVEQGIKIEEVDSNGSLLGDAYNMKDIKEEQNPDESNYMFEDKNELADCFDCTNVDSKDFLLSDVHRSLEKTRKEDTDYIPRTESDSSSFSPEYDEDSDMIYSCKRCDFKTKYKGNLKQHQNAKHLGKIELCQFCGNKYRDRSNLNRHIRVAHKGKYRKSLLQLYNCIYCAFSTFRKENLSSHMNSLHTLEKVYPCEICDYVGTRLDSYRRHKQAKHETKEKHYKCIRCSFRTLRRDFFERHFEDSHAEVKLYACTFCEYKATFSCNLTRHIRRKHSE